MRLDNSTASKEWKMAGTIPFEDAEKPGKQVIVEAHPQVVVSPGPKPNTATVITPDGRRVCVMGDYRDVQVQIQAAAARAHENGDAPRKNTPVS